MSMLVSLADMKTYLGITDNSQDAFLTNQILVISDAIEAYCKRVFPVRTYTENFYYSDYQLSKTLYTYMYPIISVISINEDATLVEAADYRINKPIGLITKPTGSFYAAEDTVVIYTAGYVDIPPIIQSVVYSLVSERYNKKTAGIDLSFGSDVQRISIPGTMSIDFDYSLSNNERSTPFGTILGNNLNSLDYYRSDRAALPSGKLAYYVST